MDSFEDFYKILNSVLGNDIDYYFGKFYEYLDDVFEDRKVDLNFDAKYDSLKVYKKNISDILEVASLGLRTIGVAKSKLQGIVSDFLANIRDKDPEAKTYGVVFNKSIKPIIKSFLVDIIVDFLSGEDKEAVSNLDLFDLIPRGFVDRLGDFEKNYMNAEIKTLLKTKDFKIDALPVIAQLETVVIPPTKKAPPVKKEPKKVEEVKPKVEPKPIKKKIVEEKPAKIPTKTDGLELDILEKIKQHKIDSAKYLESYVTKQEDETTEVLSKISQRLTEDITFIETLESDTSILEAVKEKAVIDEVGNFIGYFGAIPELPTAVKDNLQVIKENFLKINTREFQDLETFYYYIACLKMMGVSLPYSSDEIANRLQNFMYDKIFSESAEAIPDPLNIFFGTAIFSEFNLLLKNDVDVEKIKVFLSQELDDFLPWKLHLNAYSLITLKILERNGISVKKYLNLEKPISNFDLKSLENYYPSIDLYDKLISLKILNQASDLKSFSQEFLTQLEENLSPNGGINNNLTDTSKFYLIASMLDIDEKINSKIVDMINFIKSETKFFDEEEAPTSLSWKKDNLGYKLEVRMLYWALIALSQFPNL